MKCTVCGNKVNKLEYGKLRLQEVSVINILNEKVKTKKPLLNLTLCEKCQFEITTELVNKVLNKPEEPAIQAPDIDAMRYVMDTPEVKEYLQPPKESKSKWDNLPKHKKDTEVEGCNQDCANCDGARI